MKPITARRHLLVGAVVWLSIPLAGCSSPQAATTAETSAAIAVAVAPVTMSEVGNPIDAGGVVQARTTATIASRILAPVREVRVSPGDRVRKGQALIVLDSDDLHAASRAAQAAVLAAEQGAKAAAAELQAAHARLDLARASHDRVAGLQMRGSATAQELDDVVAALRGAEAAVAGASARALQSGSAVEHTRAVGDQASTTASFMTIAAPFDGVVTEKLVEPGNMASPGMALLRVEDTRGFRLEVRVDESRAGQIQNGATVPVFIGTGESPLAGTVTEISRAMDTDARAFLVKIDLPDAPGLRAGAFGKARFGGTPRRALTIPSTAIVHRGQLLSVFVVANGIARMRLVSLNDTEVLAGLAESELVVLSPPAGLTDGNRVNVEGR